MDRDQAHGITTMPGNLQTSPLVPSSHAPWYSVPETKLVSIEHPYIIKNIDRGIASLGGFEKLNIVRDPLTPAEVFLMIASSSVKMKWNLKPACIKDQVIDSRNHSTHTMFARAMWYSALLFRSGQD